MKPDKVDLTALRSDLGANTQERWHFDAGRDNVVADSTEYEGEDIYGTILDSRGDLHIARIWASGPDPERHASLIAAAPELLELLTTSVETMEFNLESEGTLEPDWSIADRQFCKRARAVIAKATS